MTALSTLEDWTWLARVRRPQGRKGEVFSDVLTDYPEKFQERRQLWLIPDGKQAKGAAEPRLVELIHHWPHKGGMILHFAGIDSINDAETLKDFIVAIPATERVALGEDEAYVDDLVGCEVIDLAPAEPVSVGKIVDVDRSAGPVALLVLDSPSGEILIPFAKAFLRKLDIAARRLEMALPEGLVEVNAPSSKREG